jgi:DNA polymerase delta subunit 2
MRPMRTRAERTATTFVDHNSAMFGMPAAHVEHYQYANLYFNRITELRPKVEAAACARWGQEVLSRRVKTLDCEPGEPVLVVGTLYKDMKNKPNIMDEVGRDVLEQLKPIDMTGIPKYCGEEDVLMIEDELGRLAVKMPASLQAEKLVTGVVVGLAGVLSEDGELQVEGFVMPGLPPQPPIARPRVDAPAEERYIAIVSGLRVGCDAQDMLALQLLAEHLTGHLGCDEDHKLQANVVRLIVAGNAMSSPAITGDSSSAGGPKPNILEKLTPLEQKDLSGHVRTLDQFLTAVSASIPVDLMPGRDDPCNYLLPQQPFHPCLLPHSSQLSTLNLCTNPYCCDVDGVRVLGTSGQPLDDMLRYNPGDDRLQMLQRTLEFQHFAPTSPDTLGCYPFADKDQDPFVIRQCPHVYFAGNQPRFESALVEGPAGQRTRTIMVPDFLHEHTCVLVNLETLECKPMSFSGLMSGTDDAPMQL